MPAFIVLLLVSLGLPMFSATCAYMATSSVLCAALTGLHALVVGALVYAFTIGSITRDQ